MSVSDGLVSPIGHWIARRLWWFEHAFERARASDKAVDDTRLRIFFVLALFGAAFVTLSLGATRAALFSRYGRGGEPLVVDPSARGELVDRNGAVLAMDVPRYGLYLDPRDVLFKSNVRAALAPLLPAPALVKLDRALASDHREYIAGGLTPELEDQIHDLGLPGVSFEEESGRAYPLDNLAAHLIGFSSKDGAGLAGAEKAFDAPLRAEGGRNATPLSIDLKVQGALEDELDQAAATFRSTDAVGMVVNVRTGEILGLASWPSFDPNHAADADPRAMVNHAAATVYEPGSVMKVFTLAMGLDAGVATLDSTFDVGKPLTVGSQTIHDFDKGDARLTLAQVFTHSSNIGAATLGLRAGADRMSAYYKGFGLFDAAPSELAESTRPLLPRRMTDNAVASMSFGHSFSVSPLAVATGMSAILNGGVWRPLTLKPLARGAAPAPGRRVIREATSRTMLGLMRLNVTQGTGTRADVAGLRVGGKTGTATKLVGGRYVEGKNALNLASFAAVFPTDGTFADDRYLVLVMFDEPKPVAADNGVTTGGFTAAPTAGRVIERIAPLLGVKRVIIASDLAPKPPKETVGGPDLGANER
jgi:cell division protein FtsI (penicillin-binding protein 3)